MKSFFKLVFPAFLLASCGGKNDSPSGINQKPVLSARRQAETETRIDFARHVKPILEERCLSCHDGSNPNTLYLLTCQEEAFKNRRLVTKKPSQSLLYIAAQENHPPHPESERKIKLDSGDLIVLRRWILSGAIWPSGKAGQLKAK